MNDNQNLKDIFNTIKKNYKKFSLYGFVSALIFYIMTFTITPIYVSKATILPVDDELSLQQNLFSIKFNKCSALCLFIVNIDWVLLSW